MERAGSRPNWRLSRLVYGFDPESGRQVPIRVGLLNTVAGGLQLALQVDDHDAVILPLQAGNQLIAAVAELTTERLLTTAELLGDDVPGGHRS